MVWSGVLGAKLYEYDTLFVLESLLGIGSQRMKNSMLRTSSEVDLNSTCHLLLLVEISTPLAGCGELSLSFVSVW
jgi:hypothetical protein